MGVCRGDLVNVYFRFRVQPISLWFNSQQMKKKKKNTMNRMRSNYSQSTIKLFFFFL